MFSLDPENRARRQLRGREGGRRWCQRARRQLRGRAAREGGVGVSGCVGGIGLSYSKSMKLSARFGAKDLFEAHFVSKG